MQIEANSRASSGKNINTINEANDRLELPSVTNETQRRSINPNLDHYQIRPEPET